MAMFLIDNDKSYSYDDLLQSLNISSEYCPLYKTSDIYSYFVNLIKALAANKPLVLLDSDLNPAEIDGVDEHLVNAFAGAAEFICLIVLADIGFYDADGGNIFLYAGI